MSADTVAVPLPSPARLAHYWQTAKTAAKTCVVLLAVVGGAHVTEPLRADTPPVVAPVHPGKAARSGK